MKESVAAERVLLLRQRLLQNIVDMVNVCNQQAAEQKQRDPLSHTEYHLTELIERIRSFCTQHVSAVGGYPA